MSRPLRITPKEEEEDQGVETPAVDEDNGKGGDLPPSTFDESNLISCNAKADPIYLMTGSIGSDLISHDNDVT